MTGQTIELNFYGRDYEQELRPLVRAFYADAELFVCHYECDEESVAAIEAGLLGPSVNADYVFQLLLLQDRYHICLYRHGELAGEEQADGCDPERKAFRNGVARAVYRLLQEVSGKALPWGIMTGVRPTKQVLERVERGDSDEAIAAWLQTEYLCSEEKIAVSLQVCHREEAILQELDAKNGYSIYVGIPFCPTTCHYCSFTSFPYGKFGHLADAYLDALEQELAYTVTCFPGRPISTVYIGGGTPTALSEAQLARLLGMLHRYLPIAKVPEFTVEAGRPDSLTGEKLRLLKESGATRISVNPQTMQQKTLDLIGRRHTVEQIVEAFYEARAVGHDNINMDLIIGLTGETPQDVEATLVRIGELQPDSLTVHTLAKKRAARLTTERERYEGLAAVGVSEMQKKTEVFAAANGYAPYYLYRQKNMEENLENVGYAKPGKEGLYNVLIMEERQTILAVGAGAMSKFVYHGEDRIERVENVKDLTHYITRVDEMIARKEAFLQASSPLF